MGGEPSGMFCDRPDAVDCFWERMGRYRTLGETVPVSELVSVSVLWLRSFSLGAMVFVSSPPVLSRFTYAEKLTVMFSEEAVTSQANKLKLD